MTHHDTHQRINALCAQARRLAPKVADQALDSGCTNDRPTGPRQAKAWDLVQEAFALNETTVADEYSIATLNKETNDMTPCPTNPDATHKAGVIGRRTCAWCDDITTEETSPMTHYAEQSAHTPRCHWCGKSVDGDYGADRGPGTPILCFACRTLPTEPRPVPRYNTECEEDHNLIAEASAPIPCFPLTDDPLRDAVQVAKEEGLRYVIRNTITGMLWATDHAFADVDAILWDAEKGL